MDLDGIALDLDLELHGPLGILQLTFWKALRGPIIDSIGCNSASVFIFFSDYLPCLSMIQRIIRA
jgi:hypothetical protein